MYKESDYLMWLSCIVDLGSVRANKLLGYFGSGEEVYNADINEILEVVSISDKIVDRIVSSRGDRIMEKRLRRMEKMNIKFIGISDKLYPYMLKEIQAPPVGLYIIGQLPDENLAKVSIIGSRQCSTYGSGVAYNTAFELAENNVVVVSGMAYGIDSIAHKGCLDGKGKTIAVLGNGVDICYPASNRELRERIIENGCVMSEYPPGTEAKAYHFPVRNRIISGLSDVTLVVEAEKKSGTLITVGQALDQGRDIFAVPGNITSPKSEGTNDLLRQGAYIFTKTEDILEVLRIETTEDNKINNKNIENTLATEEKLVYDCIGLEPISVDELLLKTKSEISSLQYVLTMLEIKGVIRKISGQRYIRT